MSRGMLVAGTSVAVAAYYVAFVLLLFSWAPVDVSVPLEMKVAVEVVGSEQGEGPSSVVMTEEGPNGATQMTVLENVRVYGAPDGSVV